MIKEIITNSTPYFPIKEQDTEIVTANRKFEAIPKSFEVPNAYAVINSFSFSPSILAYPLKSISDIAVGYYNGYKVYYATLKEKNVADSAELFFGVLASNVTNVTY